MSESDATPAAMPRERLGPLVHRSVRHGAILWILGVVEFLVGMGVTQAGYSGTSYSLTANYISDLGAAHCGFYHSNGIYVCSPWHLVFNISIILLGLLLIFGALLLATAFRGRVLRTVGLGLLVIAGIGAMGVGFSPEDVNLTVHTASAATAFFCANLALIVLSIAMFRDTRWDGFRTFTMVMGIVGLVALGLFVAKTYGPLGVGGMERLIVAPNLLWAFVAGIHLVRIPTYAPPKVAAVHG